MKKKYVYRILAIIGFIGVFLPLNAKALTLTPTLNCTSQIKKNSTATCYVTVNVTDGVLGNFSAKLTTDGSIITSTSSTVSATGNWNGSSRILTFTVSSNSKTGAGNVTLSNIEVQDSEGNKGTLSGASSLSKGIKVLNDDSRLKEIRINHAALTGFSPVKKSYTITANAKSININAVQNDANAKVTGTGTKKLACGNNKATLNVRAEDGTSNAYVLNIKRECNKDATLKDIVLSSGTLSPAFNKDIKEYKVSVKKDVDKITIDAAKNNINQEISGTVIDRKLEYGENKFAIKVKAEDGTVTTYNLTITRDDSRSSNTNLTGITLSDGKLNFDPNTTEYKTKVLYEVTSLSIVATPEDATSKVTVTGGEKLIVGDNTIKIRVTSEKGEEKEYTIIVTRLKEGETLGDNANIKKITITGYTLDFLSTKTNYTLKIKDESTLSITVELEDPTSTYQVLGNSDLKDDSIITIRVTSQDGTVKDYKIKIEKGTGYLLYIIISIVSFSFAIVLTVYLIIKTKKGKETFIASDQITETPIVTEENEIKSVTNETINENGAEVVAPNVKVEEQSTESTIPQPNKTQEIIENPMINEKAVPPTPIVETPEEQKQTIPNVEPKKDDEINLEELVTEITEEAELKDTAEIPSVASILAKASQVAQPQETSVKKCAVCGHEIPGNATKCPFCKVDL